MSSESRQKNPSRNSLQWSRKLACGIHTRRRKDSFPRDRCKVFPAVSFPSARVTRQPGV